MLTFAYAFRPWDFTLHVTRKFLIPELDRGMDYASFAFKKKNKHWRGYESQKYQGFDDLALLSELSERFFLWP